MWYLSALIFLGQSIAWIAMDIPLKVVKLKSDFFFKLLNRIKPVHRILSESTQVELYGQVWFDFGS